METKRTAQDTGRRTQEWAGVGRTEWNEMERCEWVLSILVNNAGIRKDSATIPFLPARPPGPPLRANFFFGPLQRGIKMLIYVRCASEFACLFLMLLVVAPGPGPRPAPGARFSKFFRSAHKKRFHFSLACVIFCFLLFSQINCFCCHFEWNVTVSRNMRNSCQLLAGFLQSPQRRVLFLCSWKCKAIEPDTDSFLAASTINKLALMWKKGFPDTRYQIPPILSDSRGQDCKACVREHLIKATY